MNTNFSFAGCVLSLAMLVLPQPVDATPLDRQPGGAAGHPRIDFVRQADYHRAVELMQIVAMK